MKYLKSLLLMVFILVSFLSNFQVINAASIGNTVSCTFVDEILEKKIKDGSLPLTGSFNQRLYYKVEVKYNVYTDENDVYSSVKSADNASFNYYYHVLSPGVGIDPKLDGNTVVSNYKKQFYINDNNIDFVDKTGKGICSNDSLTVSLVDKGIYPLTDYLTYINYSSKPFSGDIALIPQNTFKRVGDVKVQPMNSSSLESSCKFSLMNPTKYSNDTKKEITIRRNSEGKNIYDRFIEESETTTELGYTYTTRWSFKEGKDIDYCSTTDYLKMNLTEETTMSSTTNTFNVLKSVEPTEDELKNSKFLFYKKGDYTEEKIETDVTCSYTENTRENIRLSVLFQAQNFENISFFKDGSTKVLTKSLLDPGFYKEMFIKNGCADFSLYLSGENLYFYNNVQDFSDAILKNKNNDSYLFCSDKYRGTVEDKKKELDAYISENKSLLDKAKDLYDSEKDDSKKAELLNDFKNKSDELNNKEKLEGPQLPEDKIDPTALKTVLAKIKDYVNDIKSSSTVCNISYEPSEDITKYLDMAKNLNVFSDGSLNFDSGMDGCEFVKGVLKDYISKGFFYIQLTGLALVLVLGTLDYVQAILSFNNDEIKKANGKFTKRLLALLLLLLVPLIFDILVKGFAEEFFCNPIELI